MELQFPIEFVVMGTPVSSQTARSEAKIEWKERVREASRIALQDPFFAFDGPVAVTLYFFPAAGNHGDIDNMIKYVLDALSQHIIIDDSQVVRIVMQKFELGSVLRFSSPSAVLEDALGRERPLLYVRISDDLFEDLV